MSLLWVSFWLFIVALGLIGVDAWCEQAQITLVPFAVVLIFGAVMCVIIHYWPLIWADKL